MNQVFSSPHLHVFLHGGQYATIELKWLDFANSEQLRENLLRGLDSARAHRAKAWIADHILVRATRPRDFEWMGLAFIAPLDQLGVRRIAVLESQNAINAFLSSTGPGITSRTFPTAAETRAWDTGLL